MAARIGVQGQAVNRTVAPSDFWAGDGTANQQPAVYPQPAARPQPQPQAQAQPSQAPPVASPGLQAPPQASDGFQDAAPDYTDLQAKEAQAKEMFARLGPQAAQPTSASPTEQAVTGLGQAMSSPSPETTSVEGWQEHSGPNTINPTLGKRMLPSALSGLTRGAY